MTACVRFPYRPCPLEQGQQSRRIGQVGTPDGDGGEPSGCLQIVNRFTFCRSEEWSSTPLPPCPPSRPAARSTSTRQCSSRGCSPWTLWSPTATCISSFWSDTEQRVRTWVAVWPGQTTDDASRARCVARWSRSNAGRLHGSGDTHSVPGRQPGHAV